MIAVMSLLVTLTLSLLVTRVAAMALMLTGVSREMARFQARSAFSGCGYTTTEAESIVTHPVRRRIVMMLMLLGNLGVATVAATVMVSVLQVSDKGVQGTTMVVLAAGLIILWIIATSRWIERRMNRFISYALRKWARLEVRDYVAVLHLQKGYVVSELTVEQQDWLCDQTLAKLRLPDEGVLILGLQRENGAYIGAPTADTEIREGDMLILYGPLHRMEDLDQRRKGRRGDEAHEDAVEEFEEEVEEELEEDVREETSLEA